ncbi:MAG: hypothetical protein IPM63_15140 [Acidobacteriota bacterium]|nr:MAG: hypothetical protein IPM63_15140 [Acidobacteriota bacterium]
MSQDQFTYSIDHSTSSAEIVLTSERLRVRTKGKGLADKERIIDIPIAGLRQFCLVPTIGAQNLAGAKLAPDNSYDSEFIFSYDDGGRLEKKRLFVLKGDEAFVRLIEMLGSLRPDASLLHLEPAEAQKQIGVISAAKTVWVIVAIIVGIPVLIAAFFLVSAILG